MIDRIFPMVSAGMATSSQMRPCRRQGWSSGHVKRMFFFLLWPNISTTDTFIDCIWPYMWGHQIYLHYTQYHTISIWPFEQQHPLSMSYRLQIYRLDAFNSDTGLALEIHGCLMLLVSSLKMTYRSIWFSKPQISKSLTHTYAHILYIIYIYI